jgi:hypothetical protein
MTCFPLLTFHRAGPGRTPLTTTGASVGTVFDAGNGADEDCAYTAQLKLTTEATASRKMTIRSMI